jgi:hypothetical protein
MTKENLDYSEFQEDPTENKDAMAQLQILAQRQVKAEAEVLEAEENLKEKNKAFREIAERQLPELMASLGLKKFVTQEGFEIDLTEKLRASVAGKRMPLAVAWLDEHGHGDLVKRVFEIQFNKDEQAWANKFAADLMKRKKQVRAMQKNSVNTNTLVSFLTERIEDGEDIPLETFGAYWQKQTKVKSGK